MGSRDLRGTLKQLRSAIIPPPPADATTTDVERDELIAKDRERGRLSFYEFVKMAWHIVEPARKFVDGPHIAAICEHLQAVTDGHIHDLIINIPPRHMKSTLVCVLWPAWEWIDHPQNAFLTSAYADRLSIRDAVKTRRVIQSVWYRERWGTSFVIASDQNAKTRYDNDKGGYRIATSVQGLGTGEGGDRIVVDDPHNVLQAESQAVREGTITWWDETMSTRGNDPKTVARIIVMQRVHFADLTGHCLEKGGYTHLCLPAEWERLKVPYGPTKHVKFVDWRKKPGELLWPARFGTDELAKLKSSLGTYGVRGAAATDADTRGRRVVQAELVPALQHRPRERPEDRVDRLREQGEGTRFLLGLRTVHRATEGDNRAWAADVVRERWEYPDLKRNVISFCQKHQPNVVLIEDKGNGTALIQDLRRDPKFKWPIIPIEPEGDKIMRAQRTSPVCEAKLIVLPPNRPGSATFELEISRFPWSTSWTRWTCSRSSWIASAAAHCRASPPADRAK
jgi:predicted phage terminase large subunit-like protein